MSDAEPSPEPGDAWFSRVSWGWADIAALLVWTGAIAWILRGAITFRGALFYFDITEINYPYRAFFADELRAGRFSRWCPWLYCGMPLYSESQAGYLHPLKYLLYPWLETWKAFNLDTVLSVWLTGAGTYGWLRRHVRPAAALTGGALFGLGGFTWAHLVHTSMINALASVPFVVWGLEWSWERGRWRGVVGGAFALACQVFAGHLQDVLLTAGIVACYGAYRGCTAAPGKPRGREPAMAAVLIGLGVLLSAVQWIPSKELLDRSPRAGGLSYRELTYASWSPELLPTLLVREAYGTRARDTDWMDGYYPYHEMDVYLGALGLMLATLGAGGAGRRDRWTGFWVVLAAVGGLLMLGKFTFLFDQAHRIPILGSSREPVRFHLWVSLAVAALSAVGVDRLARPGSVQLRGAVALLLALAVVSIPLLIHVYAPAWTDSRNWNNPQLLSRTRWLRHELTTAVTRNGLIVLLGLGGAWWLRRGRASVGTRSRLAWLFPVLVIADLGLAHAWDVPLVPPSFWTTPPATVTWLRLEPGLIRVFGDGDMNSGEPGYASWPIDFLPMRDSLDWSLPAVWAIPGAKGETPMIPKRLLDYYNAVKIGSGRFDLESVSHVLVGRGLRSAFLPSEPVGAAFVHRNPTVLPRARLGGRPVYVESAADGVQALDRLGAENLRRLVVEDPTRPLDPSAEVSGTAAIVEELPERVVVETSSIGPAYLVLADTFDPGWSAAVDGQPAPIRPAHVAFRAVFLPSGPHRVVFTYRPAGFLLGAIVSLVGVAAAFVLLWLPPALSPGGHEHRTLTGTDRFRRWLVATFAAIVLLSAVHVGPGPRLSIHERWRGSLHRFTWGTELKTMRANRP